jgi:hypothetical protein
VSDRRYFVCIAEGQQQRSLLNRQCSAQQFALEPTDIGGWVPVLTNTTATSPMEVEDRQQSGQATQSHIEAIPMRPQSLLIAKGQAPQCDPKATLKPPQCDPKAT